MAWEVEIFDFSFKNTDTVVIPQFGVVCLDTASVQGVVNPGTTGAGVVIGINQSKGVDTTSGAITSGAQPGQSCQVRMEGMSRAIAYAATTIGATLSVQDSSGRVGSGPSVINSAGPVVGLGLEAGTTQGDVITVLVNPGFQPALKQLGTQAAPLTAHATANTEKAQAHGLGYTPHIVLITCHATTPGLVTMSNTTAADNTNIYSKSAVSAATFIAYVA